MLWSLNMAGCYRIMEYGSAPWAVQQKQFLNMLVYDKNEIPWNAVRSHGTPTTISCTCDATFPAEFPCNTFQEIPLVLLCRNGTGKNGCRMKCAQSCVFKTLLWRQFNLEHYQSFSRGLLNSCSGWHTAGLCFGELWGALAPGTELKNSGWVLSSCTTK